MHYNYTSKELARFWSKVDKSGGKDACWEWMAGKVPDGYGMLYLRSKGGNVKASRLAYEIAFGAIPDGLLVLHSCDNPPCCNPSHLFLGTHQDNVDDAVKKGRQRGPRGEQSGTHKLSIAQVQEIQKRYASGKYQKRLAEEFGVSQSTISLIVNGKRWK